MTLALLIVRGGPPGGRFDLREDAIIGRVDAGIMLDDDEVSRYHAIVRVHDDGADITDLGSTNGTFVDGRRLTGRAALADGAVIRVGQTELRVVGAHP
ncbi:MAG TPA: FHA domain-containing protein [Gaiellales bacterium]|nr:FHA domain-containing protein [Gaiellales bacterium]